MDNNVIVCVDGSPSTRPVCGYAAWSAAKLEIPLTLLHVLKKSEQPAVSDLTGTIGIISREHLTEELVRMTASLLQWDLSGYHILFCIHRAVDCAHRSRNPTWMN